MDKDLQKLARRFGCWYSRYADDLTFSTNRASFPRALAEKNEEGVLVLGAELVQVIEANGFSPNSLKTRLQTFHERQVVTGIIVNQGMNVNRRFIRRIRAMIHAWARYGLDAAQDYMSKWDSKDRFPGAEPSFLNVLRGRISYLAMVRGQDDPLVRRFADQFDNLRANRDLNHGIDYEIEPTVVLEPPEPSRRRQLLTVMVTDIVNSTAQAAAVGDRRWGELRDKHDRIVRRHLNRHRGRQIKSMGDGVLATFGSPTQALRAAHAISAEVKSLGIEVRIGLHTGEIDLEGDDVGGIGVVTAARVGAEAGGSEILVSATLRDIVAGGAMTFQDRGVHELKGVPGEWRLYAAILD